MLDSNPESGSQKKHRSLDVLKPRDFFPTILPESALSWKIINELGFLMDILLEPGKSLMNHPI